MSYAMNSIEIPLRDTDEVSVMFALIIMNTVPIFSCYSMCKKLL